MNYYLKESFVSFIICINVGLEEVDIRKVYLRLNEINSYNLLFFMIFI